MQSVYAINNSYDLLWISMFRKDHPEIAETELVQSIYQELGPKLKKLHYMIVNRDNNHPIIIQDIIVWLGLLKLVKNSNIKEAVWWLLSRLSDSYTACKSINNEITKLSIKNCIFLFEHLFLQPEFKEIIQKIFVKDLKHLSDETTDIQTKLYNSYLVLDISTKYENPNIPIVLIRNVCEPTEYSSVGNRATLLELMTLQDRINNRHLKTKRAE